MKKFVKYEELKNKTIGELQSISNDVRKYLIELSKINSIHLSSNLGIVEISIGLLYCFDSPKDKIIYDTGHQCYVHKMITNRWDKIHTVRKQNGLSGFFEPSESIHDFVSLGHSGTSLSLASAIASTKEDKYVISVVGDAALNNGMIFEALNDIGNRQTKMIIIINDNGMSISKNVGAINNMLNSNESLIKSFFNSINLNYMGTYNGNDISLVVDMLKKAKTEVMNGPIVLHFKTTKGLGLKEAENDTVGMYHSNNKVSKKNNSKIYGDIAADKLIELLKLNNKIKILNPAMTLPTGFLNLATSYVNNYEDVGIAEEHAVTKASGYAINGYKTFIILYSTFLQRTYDQIMHDVSRLRLPITFLIDRCDISYGDGDTHHGIYDVAFIKTIPNSIISNASNNFVLTRLIDLSYENKSNPFFIRYTKENCALVNNYKNFNFGDWVYEIYNQTDFLIISYGHIINEIKEKIVKNNFNCDLINAIFIKPINSEKILKIISKYKKIFVFENVYYQNCLYDDIAIICFENNINIELISINIKKSEIGFGDKKTIDVNNGIDVDNFFKKYF